MEKVFVYGTLRNKAIRNKIINRNLTETVNDVLYGYTLSSITDGDESYPAIYEDAHSREIIKGEIIEVTLSELNLLDKYEGDLYDRIKVTLSSGNITWVYRAVIRQKKKPSL